MLRTIIVCGLICSALGSALSVPMPQSSRITGRIIGGSDADITQYPYQVSVRLLNSATCGGTILNEYWVLTAAHCLRTYLTPSLYSVQYGLTEIGSMENVIKAVLTMKHEYYNSEIEDYDVGLIRLETAIPFGANARPIGIARTKPAAGTVAVVTGWGWTVYGGPGSKILQQAEVQTVEHSKCSARFASVRTITEQMLCSGIEEGGKDACRGDSGGPVVANGVVIGIVSWGVGCAQPDTPGVSTNVASVSDWILSHIN